MSPGLSGAGWLRQLRAPVGRVLSRLLAVVAAPPPGLRSGRRLAGTRPPDAPVALVLLFGADDGAIAATAADLASAGAGAGAEVRPLLVLDRACFPPARRTGLAVEHVVAERTWRRRGEPGPWTNHVQVRLNQLRRDYSTDLVLILPPGGTPALPPGALTGWLRPERPSTAELARRRLGALLERLLDPSARG